MSTEDISGPIRVDSIAEQYAYVAAFPPESGHWRIESQTFGSTPDGMEDRFNLRSDASGDRIVRFAVGSFFGTPGRTRSGVPTTEFLDAVMERADAAARETGAHHPGSLPRFPMPSDRYPGRLEVPMPILAVESGRRGLYAPTRIVTMDVEALTSFGVGEFPGFDPEDWPPPRIGDWPPMGTMGFDRVRLAGTIARFNAVAVRLYDAFFSNESYPQVQAEQDEYSTLLAVLDVPDMDPYYRRVSATFFRWLQTDDG